MIARIFILALFSIVASYAQPRQGIAGFNPKRVSSIKYWIDAGLIAGTNGSNITASMWVDQSSTAKGALVNATNCIWRSSAGNGTPCVEFDGATSFCTTPSFVQAQPFTIFMVVDFPNWNGLAGMRLVDGKTANKAIINSQGGGSQKTLALFATTVVTNGNSTFDQFFPQVIVARFDGASSSLQLCKNPGNTGNPGSNGYTDGMTIGAAGGGTLLWTQFQVFEMMVCDSTLSTYNRTLLLQYLMQKHKIPNRSVFVFDGNSLTSGTGASAGLDYPSQLLSMVGGTNYYRNFNFGVTGQTTVQMSADAATQIDPLKYTFAKKLLAAWEISNDIVVSNATDTVAENNWLNYCTNRQNVGWSVITLTVIARTNFTAQMRTYADSVNTWMRANWQTFSSALADVAADSRLSNFADTNYFATDGIHLNANGYAVVAGIVYTQVLTIPNP